MDNPEPAAESEEAPQVEIEVDPFESIVDDVVTGTVTVTEAVPEDQKEEVPSLLELKQEPVSETPDVSEEKPKKKRGRPKKARTYSKDSSSSNDDLPLKRKRSTSEASEIKSEGSQEDTGTSRRSHRSTRPSSFITKYDTGSGSEDEKIAYKGTHLSDDEYTPNKEPGKGKKKKRYDSSGAPLNGNAVKNLLDDLDTSQDAMGLDNIKIESVSSIADTTFAPKTKKTVTQFKSQQVDAASLFLTQIMRSTSNLGTFVQNKSEEFITARLTPGFISDTEKLHFCMEKSFKLLDLIKSNLKVIDQDLKQKYVEFIKQSKLEKAVMQDKNTTKFLSEHKIVFNKNGTMSCPEAGAGSDSDCEIVAEIPSTPKKSLDILRRVERNGISWKAQRGSVSSECSDGSTKIQIPGHSAIFLNRNIKVKKLKPKTPQFESFFREDGRTLKPPDDRQNAGTKYKIKKLEKTTLILGWLDLAYRKVSKQFFDIIKEFERRKHYDSCSDLGESCSDGDIENENDDEGIYCNLGTNTEVRVVFPKTLSKMCIDEINRAIRPSCTISYETLEEQYKKSIMSLKRYYSFADEIFLDDYKSVSPDSLLKLCMDKINNTVNIDNLIRKEISCNVKCTEAMSVDCDLRNKDNISSSDKDTVLADNIQHSHNKTFVHVDDALETKEAHACVDSTNAIEELCSNTDVIEGANVSDALPIVGKEELCNKTLSLDQDVSKNVRQVCEDQYVQEKSFVSNSEESIEQDGNTVSTVEETLCKVTALTTIETVFQDNSGSAVRETVLQDGKSTPAIEETACKGEIESEKNKNSVSTSEKTIALEQNVDSISEGIVNEEKHSEEQILPSETSVEIILPSVTLECAAEVNKSEETILPDNACEETIEKGKTSIIEPSETISPDKIATETVSSDKTPEEAVEPDKTSMETILPSETSQDTTLPDKTSEESILPDKTSGESILPDKTSGESILPDKTSGESILPDKTSEESILPDKTSQESVLPGKTLKVEPDAVSEETTPLDKNSVSTNKETEQDNTTNLFTESVFDTIKKEMTENEAVTSNFESLLENADIKAENIVVKPDICSNDENDGFDNEEFGEDIPLEEDKLITSSDGEDPMLQVAHEVYGKMDRDKYTKKTKKALEDLLESSSSEGDNLTGRKKKKKMVKRGPKKKDSKKPESKVADKEESILGGERVLNKPYDVDGWTIHNYMKDDLKLTMQCRVNLQVLPWKHLQPFQEFIQNAREDMEIDRLLDFSSLAPRSKTKSAVSDESRDSPNTTRAKKTREKSTKNDGGDKLIDLIKSGVADESLDSGSDVTENSEGLCDDEASTLIQSVVDDAIVEIDGQNHDSFLHSLGLRPSGELPEETLEDLAKKHHEKSNLTAKNLLVLSSSDDSESENVAPTSKAKRKIKPKIGKEKTSEIVKKSSPSKTGTKNEKIKSAMCDLVSIVSSSDDENSQNEAPEKVKTNAPRETLLEKLLSAPSTEPTASNNVSQSSQLFTKELTGRRKKERIRKKKIKIITESDEERKKFRKKRNRILRRETKLDKERQNESSEGSSVLTMSSGDSDFSNDDHLMAYEPSFHRPNANTEYFTPVIKREPGLEHSPRAPRTKKAAYTQQSNDLSDENRDTHKTPTKNQEEVDNSNTPKGRKKIREMLGDDCLLDTTKLAAKEEEERLRRLSQKNTQLSEIFCSPNKESPESVRQTLVLDADMETKVPLLSVNPALVKIMKEHQIDGVKFMWDTCFESVRMVKDGAQGGGCILAHCMGLGKSLQVVSLIHTLLSSNLPFRTVLICCPLSTVLNWADEFKKWLRKIDCAKSIKIYELSKFKKHYERSFHLEDWHRTGGVFIMGYEMFRLLTSLREAPDCKAHVIKKISATLLNPGPDIVVCDEGHLLKNDNTTLAKSMNKIRSRRRIVLTGTPLQNNLKEYYCMVNFVKPNLLGSRKEYFNRFENPILNGQHRDSSAHDIKIMKKRSHVLHKMLEGCVQRKEATLLYKYLPRKREFVLLVTLSDCQAKIYRHYLSKYANSTTARGAPLLKDFHTLQKIWTHPRTLHKFFIKSRENKIRNRPKEKVEFTVDSDGVICLEDVGDVAEETLAAPDDTDWWMEYITKEGMESIECSPKFTVALQLLDECLQAGDKMLIFSTSLFTLDAMEFFLRKNKEWVLGRHYYRLDGSVTLENRQKWCRNFNSERNKDVKLFLISTRAGGLGINMIAANRVIIMDVSWNPSHDIQSIFRVYRFGQKKDCYIYRLVAMGTMEEKIYERSVTKQAISCRVVDEQQIDRHYNTAELSELYTFNPVPAGPQPVPSIPSDDVLAAVLASSITASAGHRTASETDSDRRIEMPTVWSLHEHDSLLRDLRDEQLPEEERAAAWLEYQAEREQQKKQKEKDKAKQMSSTNCIIPDRQLPEMRPLGSRYKQPSYADLIKRCVQMNQNIFQGLTSNGTNLTMDPSGPMRVPSISSKPRILSRPNSYTLGSYSTMLPLDEPDKSFPSTSNQITPYAVQSTSYALPLPSFEHSYSKYLEEQPTPPMPQISNVQGNWVVPSSLSELYKSQERLLESLPEIPPTPSTSAAPVKIHKKRRSSTAKKRKTPKKKAPAQTSNKDTYPKRLLDLDDVVYVPPIINGYNSSDAESIVPDRHDSPVVTIELD